MVSECASAVTAPRGIRRSVGRSKNGTYPFDSAGAIPYRRVIEVHVVVIVCVGMCVYVGWLPNVEKINSPPGLL